MVRIDMEIIVDELSENFTKVLRALIDEACPGNDVDNDRLIKIFRNRLERGFDRWENVTDRSIDSDYS